jgi:hypothetical protein
LPSIIVTFFVLLAVAQASTTGSVTAAQLTASFKRATGDKLLVNKKASYPGHFRAYDVGVQTIAKKGKYGTFTVYLVTGADVAYEVNDLLADGHTGQLGTPGPGKIYWEQGASAFGDKYWLAKKQYGDNVVLWWFTSSTVKKTDKTFKRLHTTLTTATK